MRTYDKLINRIRVGQRAGGLLRPFDHAEDSADSLK